MAVMKYTYSVSGDFPNQKVNDDALTLEINGSAISSAALSYITIHDNECDIWFDGELSAEDQTTLDGVVAAHQGVQPLAVRFLASSVLTDHETTVTDTAPGWTELGGAVTTPSFFSSNLPFCKGRVVGQYKTNGEGAKIRLREGDAIPTEDTTLPDSGGEWANMQWYPADAPTEGTHAYTLEGQLPTSGATAMSVKYVAVSLLEFYS